MDLSIPIILVVMLLDFRSRQKAASSAWCINSAFGKDTFSEHTAYDWCFPSCTGNNGVEDPPWSGRSYGLCIQGLWQLFKNDPQQTTGELLEASGMLQSTVVEHLREIGFVSKLFLLVA